MSAFSVSACIRWSHLPPYRVIFLCHFCQFFCRRNTTWVVHTCMRVLLCSPPGLHQIFKCAFFICRRKSSFVLKYRLHSLQFNTFSFIVSFFFFDEKLQSETFFSFSNGANFIEFVPCFSTSFSGWSTFACFFFSVTFHHPFSQYHLGYTCLHEAFYCDRSSYSAMRSW